MKAKLLKIQEGFGLSVGDIVELELAKEPGSYLGKYTTKSGTNKNWLPIIQEEDVEILD